MPEDPIMTNLSLPIYDALPTCDPIVTTDIIIRSTPARDSEITNEDSISHQSHYDCNTDNSLISTPLPNTSINLFNTPVLPRHIPTNPSSEDTRSASPLIIPSVTKLKSILLKKLLHWRVMSNYLLTKHQ